MSRCNDCLKRINESCYLMGDHPNCRDFVPAPKKEHQKPKSARYKSGDDREYRNAPKVSKPTDHYEETSGTGTKRQHLNKTVDVGQKLYFRNTETGKIEYGVITEKRQKTFYFQVGSREERLDYRVIGDRLFLTVEAVNRSGK